MNTKAFTLIELVAVVAMVAILTSIALPQYHKMVEKSRFTKAQVMAKALHSSCERLVAEWGVENYGKILTDSTVPASAKKLSRLDIGGKEELPPGFSISDDSNQISGATFIYTLRQSGECYVIITKPSWEPYYGVTIGYNGNSFTCSGNATACNLYGLD